jgi:hypothetical protein
MRFVLERTYEEKGTRGELFDEEGDHVCLMIERPKTGEHPCIPEGTYVLTLQQSQDTDPIPGSTKTYPVVQTSKST